MQNVEQKDSLRKLKNYLINKVGTKNMSTQKHRVSWTKSVANGTTKYIGNVKNKTMFFVSEVGDGSYLLEFTISSLILGKTGYDTNIVGYYTSAYIAKCTAERFLEKIKKFIS